MEDKSLILKVTGLSVEFDNHVILDNVSFEIVRDSTLAIIGPNGAGKSVLFRALLGLIPYKGTVTWNPEAKIGYVPQKLFVAKDLPLTVNEFLHFKEKNQTKIHEIIESVGFITAFKKTSGRKYEEALNADMSSSFGGIPRRNGGEDVMKEAEHLHNDKRVLNTRLGDLSGGELQRVLIAYALLDDPNVLLFDEPTAGVDIAGEETVYGLIHKLQADEDLTIIFISHELGVVYQYADTVLCLNKEKICYGPPRNVIDKESLAKMYGEEIHLYKHHDH